MKITGRAIAAIMLMFATVLATGCTEKENNNQEENNAGDEIVLATGDWVDLGLPSGLLWATRNVGASSPTDYGNYFAWAETTPKSTYVLDNYRYYRCDDNGCGYTKYCTDSSYGHNGFTDGLTTLEPGDDAATANYGGRTPTAEEWRELKGYTTNRWVTINGVNGYCFTGSNGNSIFLPAAGYRWDSSLLHYNYYWSSSVGTAYPEVAWYCEFYSDTVYVRGIYGHRYYGLSVRAVRDAQ